jgi:hypothetical protein
VALTENYLLSLARDLQLAEGTALVLKVRDQQCLTNQSEFRFHEIIRIAQPVSPFGMLRDLAFGIARVRGPFLRDAEEFLEKLLVVNSSRVENDVKDRVLKSREQLERHIRSALQEVLHEAEAAMISAETLMKNGQASVDAEIQRMDKLEGSLELIPM